MEVAERTGAGIALHNGDERFRTLVATLPHGVLVTDLAGRITLINPAYARMHGYAEDELNGRYFWELVAGEERQQEKREFYQCLIEQQPEPRIIAGRNRKKDGTDIEVRIDWDYLRDAEGELEGVVAVLTDVTQEKRALTDLRASEARLVEAQRIARLGNWEWDIPTGALEWSDEVFRIFGYEAQQFVPSYDAFLQAVHHDDRVLVEQAIQTASNLRQPYGVEHRIVLPDGSVRMVREGGQTYYDDAGKPIRMAGTVLDITEAAKAEQELRTQRDRLAHMNRLSTMGEMATGIAHELNQPLMAIANHSYAVRQKIQNGLLNDEALLTDLQSIQQQAIRAGDIIRRLRSFVQRHDRCKSVVQLDRVVENVLAMLTAELRLADIAVSVEFPPELPSVEGDSLQLEQVLVNLLKNSLEALTDVPNTRRRIEIKSSRECTGYVDLHVNDTGPGISPTVVAQLFQPFQSSKSDGMGLGLVISRSIIEDHGGTLQLRRNSEAGVRFVISLPILDNSTQS